MHIIEHIEFTETEQLLIQEALSQSLVKKYLKSLGITIAVQTLQGSPADSESDSDYIRKEAYYKGQLAVIETLLSISAPTKE